MNRWLVIILLTLSAACTPEYSGKTPPPIVDGTIDLTGWDFERDGPVELKGEWLFAWGDFVEKAGWSELSESLRHKFPASALFDTLEGTHGIERFGYATYALRVVGLNRSDLRVIFESVGGTAKIQSLVDGAVVDEVRRGRVGKSKSEQIPISWVGYHLRLSLLEDSSLPVPSATILVHLANFHHPRGGLWAIPRIDLSQASMMKEHQRTFLSHLLLGFLLIAGLYHLVIFLTRRNDKVALYFGVFCLVLGSRVLSMGVWQSLGLAPTVAQNYFLLRIEYLSMPIMMASLSLFLVELIPRRSFRWFVTYVSVGCGGLLVLFVLSVEPHIFLNYLSLFQIEILVGLLVAILHLGYAVWEKVPLAGWCLGAFLLAALGGINDILHSNNLIVTAYIAPFTVMGFVLLQSVIIAKNFAKVFEQRDELTRRVLEKTTQLANESERRATAETALRLEAESKITLFSEVTHHLNNPLSHIQGEALAIRNTNRAISDTILELLPEDADDETSALREHFQKLFENVERSQGAVESAQVRATDAIELLRRVSGVDGIPMEPTSLAEIMDVLRKRGDVDLSFMDWRRFEEHNDHLVIGHRLVYGYLMRQVLHQMQSLSIAEEPGPETSKPVAEIQVEGDAKAFLRLSLPLDADLDMDSEIAFREALEPMDYLAQTMHGAVYFSDESWSVIVRLLAHYPEERV